MTHMLYFMIRMRKPLSKKLEDCIQAHTRDLLSLGMIINAQKQRQLDLEKAYPHYLSNAMEK